MLFLLRRPSSRSLFTSARWRCPPIVRPIIRPKPLPSVPPTPPTQINEVKKLDFDQIVHDAADLLPNQAILENFIHHNPFHHFEDMAFQDALNHVRDLESYLSPGERVLSLVHVDPRKRVNEALVELCAVFLDRGAAHWAPHREKGFLYFFASLEHLGFAAWRRQARDIAARIVRHMDVHPGDTTLRDAILQDNLRFFGIPPEEYTSALRAMLLELRGWAGMFYRMETHPEEAPPQTLVRLIDFCTVKTIFIRASAESLARQAGWERTTPFAEWLSKAPKYRQAKIHQPHSSALAYVDQRATRREILETEFKLSLVHAIGSGPVAMRTVRPIFQLYTCIDDRECSFRRHVEESDPNIETFGVAGFFGIPLRYQPIDGVDQMVLAPEGVKPQMVLVENAHQGDQQAMTRYKRRRRWLAKLTLLWENASFSPTGSLVLSLFAPFSLARLCLMSFAPNLSREISQKLVRTVLAKPQTDVQLPYEPKQAAAILARGFKDIGTQDRFAPIAIVLGHGSISVNNPFAAAYNCGACGGREGGPNARVLARMANDKLVRQHLLEDHGIVIPDDTLFVGGMHNTTAETVVYFDVDLLPASSLPHFERAREIIEAARAKNALERCSRFLLSQNVRTSEDALGYVQTRSADVAEVRPELNHATNAGVVVGRRDLTRGRFLDRRVFLPSYDPFSDDANGTNLEHVLAPALVVCSGINLEYLFSTISVDHHGAGTKAPLNVVGNIGVIQGTTGDLRPGLPSQMTEMHTPIRALFIVDAPISTLEAVLARRQDLRQLVRNEWVRVIVRDPYTGHFFVQSSGEYSPMEADETTKSFVPFAIHRSYAMLVARREQLIYGVASAGMVLACAIPMYMYGLQAMNPRGMLIALSGTGVSLSVLAFARRYLHGEFMLGRFSGLCVGLVLGFNLISLAPTLEHALAGWSLFGFASTFLIGAYNDRPTVRNNATFAFAAYQISDMGMLVATTFAAHHGAAGEPGLAAAGLLLAALFKSSQFPLTSLFVRSMEGPTPASALGYAGLSAHAGVILLTSTMPLWFGFEWARLTLASVGLITAVYSSLVSKIRADRKGAIACATSGTLGVIFMILAAGYPDVALALSLGHAVFRMIQILRAPSIIADSQKIRNGLGYTPPPKVVPDWLYRLCWGLQRRFHSDATPMHALHLLGGLIHTKPLKLNKFQQWAVTAVTVVIAGIPFTPLSNYKEHVLMELLPTHPVAAAALMLVQFGVSVTLIRFLLLNVLSSRRFRVVQEAKTKMDNLPKRH